MFNAVIFDLDGVLIDSEEVHIQTTQRGFQKYGYSLTDEELQYIVGRHPKDYVPYIIEKNKLGLDPESVRLAARELFISLWGGSIRLMPLAKETINELNERGVELILATNSNSEIAGKFIKKFSLEGIFSGQVTGDKVSKRKPDPEIYLRAKSLLDIPADEIVAVEDSENGVIAAKVAGLPCIAIPNKYTKNMDFSTADYIVDSLKDVTRIVLGAN